MISTFAAGDKVDLIALYQWYYAISWSQIYCSVYINTTWINSKHYRFHRNFCATPPLFLDHSQKTLAVERLLTGKGIIIVHRRVITDNFDTPKPSRLWLVIEHFMVLSKFWRRILYKVFKMYFEREFGPLDPYLFFKNNTFITFWSVVFPYNI